MSEGLNNQNEDTSPRQGNLDLRSDEQAEADMRKKLKKEEKLDDREEALLAKRKEQERQDDQPRYGH